MADGSISLRDAPPGTVRLTVDHMDGPIGTVPVTLHVRLPDGRIVGVAIEAERSVGKQRRAAQSS